MSERGQPQILIVEDEPEMRQVLADMLARPGWRVTQAADGVEALELLAARRPDVVLTDLNMPRMDGREALEHIKSDPTLRKIPVVIMTTSRAEEDIDSSYDHGASGFVVKPVEFDGLVAAIQSIGKYWFEFVERPDTEA